MKRSYLCVVIVAGALSGLAGCQSAPKWAFWKKNTPPQESSAIARSAAPALPSTQASSNSVTVPELQPATSPSAANLAASGGLTPSSATPVGAASNSPAAAGIYPATSTPTMTNASALAAAPTSQTQAFPATNAMPAAPAAAQPGPYDPNAFLANVPTGTAPSPAAATDRYGNLPAQAAASVDRYGLASEMAAAATASASQNAGSSAPTTPDRYGILPVTSSAPSPAAAAASGLNPTANSVTQAAPTAGQYRPAGTSNYDGPASHVEVAIRPTGPTSAPYGAPQTPATAPASSYSLPQQY